MKRAKVDASRSDALEELCLDLCSKIPLIYNDVLRPIIQQSTDSCVSVATLISSTEFLVQIGMSQDVSVPLSVVDSLVSQLRTFAQLRQSLTSRSESDKVTVNLLPRQQLGDALPTHSSGFCSAPVCELKAPIDSDSMEKFMSISSRLEAHVKPHGIRFVSHSAGEELSAPQDLGETNISSTAAPDMEGDDPLIERCSCSIAESIESMLRHSVDDIWREEVKTLLEANSIDEAKQKLEAMIATFLRATREV